MGRKLYVGNLSYSTSKKTLQDTFSQCGTVDSVDVITNRETGESRGFAFVEMSSNDEAQTAIQKLNGSNLDGQEIKVNEAKPKTPRDDRRGGGYGGGGVRGGGYDRGRGRGGHGYGRGGDRGNR